MVAREHWSGNAVTVDLSGSRVTVSVNAVSSIRRLLRNRGESMESYRSSRLRSLWNWLGVLVAGTRGSQKRLYLALERLRANQNPVPGHRTFYRGASDNVLRLLYRDTERAPGGLGPIRVESSRAMADEDAWFVSCGCESCQSLRDAGYKATGHSIEISDEPRS